MLSSCFLCVGMSMAMLRSILRRFSVHLRKRRSVSSILCAWTAAVIVHSGMYCYLRFPERMLNTVLVLKQAYNLLFKQYYILMITVLCVTFSYRCDDFVVNDTKLGQVQRVREHLQSLEK